MERFVARKHTDYGLILDDIKRQSVSVVSLPLPLAEAVRDAFSRVPTDLDKESVQAHEYLEAFEFGFKSAQHKRFFAMKRDHVVFSWKDDEFRQFVTRLFSQYETFAQGLVVGMLPGLEPLLEEPPEVGEISESFMHLFEYSGKPQADGTLPCGEHTDSGLITIIPKSTAPGLEVLLQGVWTNVELELADNDCVVIVGEELAGMLRQQATIHRVRTTQQRISIPFQLRCDAQQVVRTDPDALAKAAHLIS